MMPCTPTNTRLSTHHAHRHRHTTYNQQPAASSRATMSESKVPTCISDGCDKPGTMVCPKCKALGIPGSFFCGQPCFKESWCVCVRVCVRVCVV